ncbi:hypothetical protein [Undibacter mobilis]|uniref:Uncharacterized protein n=1 Tax=Undibacter mobilis TaxID=2292256 RepID=A0A371BCT7_9BRAD|nr:hypothetical protein [Undibacter mobilis]RDV05378.1 hypothetical protein DXH78_12825 [Undibacter mobilis]
MPNRNSSSNRADSPAAPETFRKRYDNVESQREELLARLNRLGAVAQAHPGHKRALKLLNDTFRKAKLAQRLSVLHAAAWLIEVLERVAAGV